MDLILSMTQLGTDNEICITYIKRFELFTKHNDIKDEKKVSTLLIAVGIKTLNLLCDT